MIENNAENCSFKKLIKLSLSIAEDPNLLSEMIQEVEEKRLGPICRMFKALFRQKLLYDLGIYSEFIHYFFISKTITEINLYSLPNLGIKCFFMPAGSSFPLHDHPNKLICTVVLYGHLRYMTLNHQRDNCYSISKKGSGKPSNVFFCTKNQNNIHTILAAEDSVILDIFMPCDAENDDLNVFSVLKKRSRDFLLKKHPILLHKHLSE